MIIALVGKYIDLPDAYLSVCEALRAGGFANRAKVVIRWVPSDDCESAGGCGPGRSATSTGSVIPGGFGIRGVEGKVGAIRYARENQIPILGLCLGLQCMVIEVARHLAGLEGADCCEFSPDAPHHVIATMAEQVAIVDGEGDLGGSMRLGSYPAELLPGSLVAKRYGQTEVDERHRHRYEVNNAYRGQLEEAGLVISGTSPDSRLVEFIELPDEVHPYFVATQAHPELKSRPTVPHPLFVGLVEAALDRRLATRLPVDDDQPVIVAMIVVSGARARRHAGGPGRSIGRPRCWPRGHDHRPASQDEIRTPDGATMQREYLRHPGRGRHHRARRPGSGGPRPAVPARGAAPADRAAGRSAGRRRRGVRCWPPSASWPRRSVWPPTPGTCWSTCSPPPASSARRCGSTWPAISRRGRAGRLRERGRGGAHGHRLGTAGRPGRRRAGRPGAQPDPGHAACWRPGRRGSGTTSPACGPPTRAGRRGTRRSLRVT